MKIRTLRLKSRLSAPTLYSNLGKPHMISSGLLNPKDVWTCYHEMQQRQLGPQTHEKETKAHLLSLCTTNAQSDNLSARLHRLGLSDQMDLLKIKIQADISAIESD